MNSFARRALLAGFLFSSGCRCAYRPTGDAGPEASCPGCIVPRPDAGRDSGTVSPCRNVPWTITTIDPIGAWPSLALDSLGNPYTTYIGGLREDLRYAEQDSYGQWRATDPAGNMLYAERPSIAVDRAGKVHIVYGTDSALHYIQRDEAHQWTWTELVDSEPSDGSGIAVDRMGGLHVSYEVTLASAKELRYAYFDPELWFWSITTVDPDANHTGAKTGIALDRSGGVHVVYGVRLSDVQSELRYAYRNPEEGTWTLSTIPDAEATSGSIAVDSFGGLHVAYGGRYARRTPDGVWTSHGVALQGDATSIAVDVFDRAHIVANGPALMYVVDHGDGLWVPNPIDDSATGHAALALDASGGERIVYDVSNGIGGYEIREAFARRCR